MYLSEDDTLAYISPEDLDLRLAKAWRRFGHYFFRYNTGFIPQKNTYSPVIPLRIRLADFEFSKSQRKILKKNAHFIVRKGLISLNQEKYFLFYLHRERFTDNQPNSLHNFIAPKPDTSPIPTYEIEVYDEKKLIATSFVDISTNAFSSIYAMFDTNYSAYSLGIYTLLQEIIWAKELNKKYLYLGYAYQESSFYDYKKKFSSLEEYIWEQDIWVNY
jgi:arginine-tRNA-protein transferase